VLFEIYESNLSSFRRRQHRTRSTRTATPRKIGLMVDPN
jgi:hypothetical protein